MKPPQKPKEIQSSKPEFSKLINDNLKENNKKVYDIQKSDKTPETTDLETKAN